MGPTIARETRVSVAILEFSTDHLSAVRRLWERMYERPRGETFYRWALIDPPLHRALVAMDGDECVAMLRAFERQYQLGDARVTCRETFDWLSAPEHRASALGLRVMRAAMQEWAPLVNVGGTPDSVRMLPALGWQTVGVATSYSLPLGAAGAASAGGRLDMLPASTRPAAVALAGAVWFRPRRRRWPPGGDVVPVGVVGDEILELYEGATGYGTLPLPDVDQLRWLMAGYPGAGQFLALYFTLGGRLRGWGLARVHTVGPALEATLVEVYAPRPTVALYTWMTSELVLRVSGHRPAMVRAQATCSILQAALRRLRFLPGGPYPVFVWSTEAPPPLHFTLCVQDGPMLPYPARWSFDERRLAPSATAAP